MKTFKTVALSLLLGLNSVSFAEQPAAPSAAETRRQEIEQPATVKAGNTVNINTAGAAELQDKLVGIGEKKAQAIVEYRNKNGNFKSLEQLTEVSGIGQATLEKNRAHIVLE